MCSIKEREQAVKAKGLSCELPFETMKDLIRQASEMRIKQLFLLGGEPFLSAHLYDTIKFAYSLGMVTVVSTNGTLLDTPDEVFKVLDSGLATLAVSIDAASEEAYARIRGEGLLEKIKNNIALFNRIKKEAGKEKPNVFVFCTIMEQNIDELMDVVELAKSLEAVGVGFQPVVADNTDQAERGASCPNWVPPSGYAVLDREIGRLVEFKLSSKENFHFISNSTSQLIAVKKYFRGPAALGRKVCYSGLNRMVISQDGRLYFCAKNPDTGEVSFGDVYRERLKDLWYSGRARRFRQSVKRCPHPCLLSCAEREEFARFSDMLRHREFS